MKWIFRTFSVCAIIPIFFDTSSALAQSQTSVELSKQLSPAFRKMAEENDREIFPEPRQGPLDAHYRVLVDESFKNEGWQPGDGIFGLRPAASTQEDVRKLLGEPEKTFVDNAKTTWWYYQQNALSLRFTESGLLSAIEVSKRYVSEPKAPKTLEEARHTFGRLDRTTFQPFGQRDYERPGLKVTCDEAPSWKPIDRLLIYDPTAAIESAKRMQPKSQDQHP
jgi:hypothetical protein